MVIANQLFEPPPWQIHPSFAHIPLLQEQFGQYIRSHTHSCYGGRGCVQHPFMEGGAQEGNTDFYDTNTYHKPCWSGWFPFYATFVPVYS